MSSSSLLLSSTSSSHAYQATPSSSSSDDCLSSASKRFKGVANPLLPPVQLAPFCLSEKPLPIALTLHAFSYLSFEQLMCAKLTSRLINLVVADGAITEYRLTSSQKKFTNEIFKHCLLRSNARRISVIDVSNTLVSDFEILATRHLPALKTLKLSSACRRISKKQMDTFSQLNPQIERICLKKCKGVDLISSLAFHQLRELDLEDMENFSDKTEEMCIQEALFLSEKHPDLQKLSLKNFFGKSILPHLKFPKLRELNLEGSEALECLASVEKQEYLAALSAHCPQLTSLNICSGLGDGPFIDLSKLEFPLMEHLDISHWVSPFQDEVRHEDFLSKGLSILFKRSPLLRSLNLSALFNIRAQDLSLLSLLTQLTTLSVANSPMDDSCFAALCTSSSPRLTSLNLSGNFDLTDEGFALGKFPELTYLDLTSCNISDKGIAHFSTNYPKLKVLKLRNANITGLGLAHITLPELTALDIGSNTGVENFNDEALSALKNNCPKLKNLIHFEIRSSQKNLPQSLKDHISNPSLPFTQEIFNHSLSQNW